MGARLLDLLDAYAETFHQGSADDSLLTELDSLLLTLQDPGEFPIVWERAWDEYSCVPVDNMIRILRRWLEINPRSRVARLSLGSYLLAHGPDWDEEARELLDEETS